jgi:hypothetical protein
MNSVLSFRLQTESVVIATGSLCDFRIKELVSKLDRSMNNAHNQASHSIMPATNNRCLNYAVSQLEIRPYHSSWRLVAGFPLWQPGFEPRSGHMGFLVHKVALGQVFFS